MLSGKSGLMELPVGRKPPPLCHLCRPIVPHLFPPHTHLCRPLVPHLFPPHTHLCRPLVHNTHTCADHLFSTHTHPCRPLVHNRPHLISPVQTTCSQHTPPDCACACVRDMLVTTFGPHVEVVEVEDSVSVHDLLADDGEAVHVALGAALWRPVL